VPRAGVGGLCERYHAWRERATAPSCVAPTLPGKERSLAHGAKYAEGKTRSKVGNAVRRGAAAHEYDDDEDGQAACSARRRAAVPLLYGRESQGPMRNN
jgi:hypothetical protein